MAGLSGRTLAGGLVSAVLTVALAYVSDTSAHEVRARRFAWMTAATTLGFLAGPVLGGWLAGPWVDLRAGTPVGGSFSAPFFMASAAGTVIWLAVWRWLPNISPPQGATSRQRGVQSANSVNVVLLLALLGMFGLGAFEVQLPCMASRYWDSIRCRSG